MQTPEESMPLRLDRGGDGGGKVREMGGVLGKSDSVKHFIIIMGL